ncbi:FMRFamide receptor-like [Physella acuta]|uniref:FMRFamide receptor-like n=1 Tax=Physella acuta TaxID=109671 RepID=UPI0027DE8DC8|nr:FMRFamide receptor-like [Physella acuta]
MEAENETDMNFLMGQFYSMSDAKEGAYRGKLNYYLMGIGGSIVCCLGTIANALSVAVLTRRAMRSSTYMYLSALAICDSLVLLFTLLIMLKDTQHPDGPQNLDQFYAVLFPFVHPTAIVFQVTSIWLTLAFTVDRYIMICHPFKAETMCRRSRARKVVIALYLAGLIFNIPRYLEYYTKVEKFKMPQNSTSEEYNVYFIAQTALGRNDLFLKVIHSGLYLTFVCGIPFLTLVILNAFLIRAVHLSRLKGKEINAREKHRNDTTIMLIGVIIIFLICQGPALVSRMIYAFEIAATAKKSIYTLNEVGSFLVMLNSAINIVPYYLFGRKFRSEFWRIFCTCFFDSDELRRIVRSYSVSVDHRRMSQYNVMEMNGVPNDNIHPGLDDRTLMATEGGELRPQKECNGAPVRSETSESVAMPLIHSTNYSLNGLVNTDLSRDSLKDSPSQPLSPTVSRPNGHAQYMTITASPCVCEPVWSVV